MNYLHVATYMMFYYHGLAFKLRHGCYDLPAQFVTHECCFPLFESGRCIGGLQPTDTPVTLLTNADNPNLNFPLNDTQKVNTACLLPLSSKISSGPIIFQLLCLFVAAITHLGHSLICCS